MRLENPFEGMAYITEKGALPESVLERYSIHPLRHIMSLLNEQINSFLVGRTGVGKTMVLALFKAEYQEALYSKKGSLDSDSERKKILKMLPKKVISVYSNIDAPYIRVTRFQGRILESDEKWMKVFGDYYGHVLAKELISSLEKLSQIEEWREHNKVSKLDKSKLDLVSIGYSKRIKDELPDASEISNWNELKKYIDERISRWIRLVSKLGAETYSGPSETVQLITPCLYLIDELKNCGVLEKDCRLFIIIDQYEMLFEHRKNIDFRPVFNLAMRQAARGETRIEFKIGVRPYGYKDNLKMLGSEGRLDLEKECNEIIIDDLTSKYYEEFIKDLSIKCLGRHPEYQGYLKNIENLFQDLTPVQEVKGYVGNSKKIEKHFSRFFNKKINGVMDKKKTIGIIQELTKDVGSVECKVWIETLLSIYAERILSKKESLKPKDFKLELKKHFEQLQNILFKECGGIDGCICTDKVKGGTRSDDPDKAKYSYKDIRTGALFIVAAAYKNTPKTYSGYSTIVGISSRIVLHYIKIVSNAFNTYLLEERNSIEELPASMQSDAIYKQATRFFEKIPEKAEHGLVISQFLKNLGVSFRNIQIDTRLRKPYPNGFSLVSKLSEQFKADAKEAEIMTYILSYGFLEEAEHKDKNQSKGKRYKYYLNRLLCPYFGIASIHGKDPVYIYGDESEFLSELLKEDIGSKELRKFIFKKGDVKKIEDTSLISFYEVQ